MSNIYPCEAREVKQIGKFNFLAKQMVHLSPEGFKSIIMFMFALDECAFSAEAISRRCM